MQVKSVSREVLVAQEQIVKINRHDIEFLKKSAWENERRRIRVCAHKGIGDKLHEMFIVHGRDTYVRPHKHLCKTESFHVIEGAVDVIVFDEIGNLREVITMGDYMSGREFYFRLSDPLCHTLLIRSDVLVFHETTTGPFDRADTVFAPWAPEENDHPGRSAFLSRLELAVQDFILSLEEIQNDGFCLPT